MPGFCGAFGCEVQLGKRLLEHYRSAWPNVKVESGHNGFLAAPSSPFGETVGRAKGGVIWAVDGDRAAVQAAAQLADLTADAGNLSAQHDRTAGLRKGNTAVLQDEQRRGILDGEWTGTYPVYYAEPTGGVLFSSHLVPLARAVNAAPDHLGAVQYLRNGYCIGRRTLFQGISRLLPGQRLSHSEARPKRLTERSSLWTRPYLDGSAEEVADELWAALIKGTGESLPDEGLCALMMSGGWDSRLVLAALLENIPNGRILCYTHGNVRSRELKVAEAIASDVGCRSHLRSFDSSIWHPSSLSSRFPKTENVVFPSWHAASALLRDAGVAHVTSGVYAGAIAGHYGSPSLLSGTAKMTSVAGMLTRQWLADIDWAPTRNRSLDVEGSTKAFQMLRVDAIPHAWYLNREFETSVESPVERCNADIEESLERHSRRGVTDLERYIECFTSEHRGSQYINAQLLSCRSDLTVSLPLADPDLLDIVTQLPLEAKVHNTLHQEILRRHQPRLLDYPLAATLVKASRPIILHEASRLVRKALEQADWRAFLTTGGRWSTPGWGWKNLEFLREDDTLHHLAESLHCQIWNRDAIHKRIQDLQDFTWQIRLGAAVDQLMKIYTVDQFYRRASRF